MKPTYDELEKLLMKALEEIARLSEEVSKLKNQIKSNSKNSSKSPSTDQKSNTPEKEKKPRASRAGKARILFPQEKIDKHVECSCDSCSHCGSEFIQLNGGAELLQQAELPEVKARITEYKLLKYTCNDCNKNSLAPLPQGVPDSAFGPKLMGLLVTLTGVFHLAKRESIQLIKELYDIDMSVGSLSNIEERVTQALEPVYQRIHGFVMSSKLSKHFDETGWRDKGKRHYVWLACCKEAAVYKIDQSRSAEAFSRLFTGKTENVSAVTDRYAVYAIFKVHQYCLAHLIREFRSYAEKEGPDKKIGTALEAELKKACHIHKKYREGKISLGQRNRSLGYCKKKTKFHLEDGIANAKDDFSGLCDRLWDDFDKLWTFMKVHGMEPTNNLAERDLRKLVIWRRKSYGTRSERGKKFVERITSVSQTLKRQSKSILSFIQEAVVSFYSKTFPPFISEAMGF